MKRLIVLILAIGMGVAGIIGTNSTDAQTEEPLAAQASAVLEDEPVIEEAEPAVYNPAISFSHTDTFYSDSIQVEIMCDDPDALIFYTVTSAPPDDTARLYAGAIKLDASSRTRATTIKAVAISANAARGDEIVYSDITTKSYLVGKNVFERFSPDTYVFVLSADPVELFDRDHGIAMPGILRREYMAETRDYNPNPPAPANYNIRGRDGEREFYVEAYDSLGNQLLSQLAGGRIAGGWSRANDQKTWRLIARNEYSEGKFKYPFFENALNANGQIISRFDRLTLRNQANDRGQAYVRDELSLELARQAGYPYVQAHAPAAVFLNSEYYGFAWLKEAFSNGYLEQMHGGVKDNYRIVQNSERASGVDDIDDDDYRIHAYEDWMYVYGLASDAIDAVEPDDGGAPNYSRSFRNDEIFNEFTSLVDIDNLMLYYAIQVYINNQDWPNNNMKMWRYYADEDEVITSEYHDGKWRFLMFDVEFAWGIYGDGRASVSTDNLRNLLRSGGGNHMGGSSRILRALMQREDMREMFANTICDLISGAFSADNVLETLEDIIAMSDPELIAAGKTGAIWFDEWYTEHCRDQIRDFARGRPAVMYRSIRRAFEVSDDTGFYSVSLTSAEGAYAWLNTRRLSGYTDAGSTITTEYLSIYNVGIKAETFSGYEFIHWEINGEIYPEQELQVNAKMADRNGSVNIVLVTGKAAEGMPLLISRISSGSGKDWVELKNPNSVAVSTKSYFLSDTADNLKRWKIPSITIQPDETLTIVASNNSSPDTLMKPQMNFSLKEGETLFLSDMSGEIISSVFIPATENGEILVMAMNGAYNIQKE